MKVAITGSSGFIGHYLVQEFRNLNIDLLLLDISTGIDVCDWEAIKTIKGIDVFIHLANLTYVPDSYLYPHRFYNVNYISTLNILELCRLNNSKMIYLSSYVYGNPNYVPIDEKHPIQGFNPYSRSKIICEQLCEGYSRDFNVPVVIFRPFNIYGKGQNGNFLIPSLIRQIDSGKIVVNDFRPKRDYIHVVDVVNAIVKAVFCKLPNPLETFNLGFGMSFSVQEVIDILKKYAGKDIEIECINNCRQNEVLNTVANIDKAKIKLGWEPHVNLENGLFEILKK